MYIELHTVCVYRATYVLTYIYVNLDCQGKARQRTRELSFLFVIGSEETCHVAKKTYFNFIYDCYETTYVLNIALYYIVNEHSEVKLRPFKKSCSGKRTCLRGNIHRF